MDKVIITAALIGSGPMREQNPNLPYGPAEIAAEAIRAWRAGAAVVHVHVRDPQTGAPAFARHLFAEVVDRVRAESDVIINLTTSGFNLAGPESGQQRLMPLELQPEMCSLDVGSLNFRQGRVFLNPSDWVEMAARAMVEAGVKPEMEVFDLGHIRQANDLIRRSLIKAPPYFQLCLGIPWGIEASLESLLDMKRRLPSGCLWSALAAGKDQLPINAHTLLLGGHVRVGFEDNVYLSAGVKAESNAQFVERIVNLARLLGREAATPAEARTILGLAQRA